MAQQRNQVDIETLCCSICLDLLKVSVTIPCGHSYCMRCIQDLWDTEEEGIYRCPQCRKSFAPRPQLVKNVVLADLVEELKRTGLQDAPADYSYAGPEDVACDFCAGRKLKAARSCLTCLASYCEKHLQPHFDVAPFKKHTLVDPCEHLQENVCPRHDEAMNMFCRSDQQCICYLCSVEEHKGHDTVSAAAERAERQKDLAGKRQKVQRRIQDGERKVKLQQQEAEALRGSADRAADDSEKIFSELIRELQRRMSEVKQQIRAQREVEESRIKVYQEKLEQEIAELKRRDAALEQLARTQDHKKFLKDYPALSTLGPSTHMSCTPTGPLRYFEDVTVSVSRVRGQIQEILAKSRKNISQAVTEVDVLLQQPEPKRRADVLKYSRDIELDPNTANRHLLLSDGNRKVTRVKEEQSYSDHPDRFTVWSQVLSRESLTGRCYWEVEIGGKVHVAVAYKNISRVGDSNASRFGLNDKSWILVCDKNGHSFHYNDIQTPVPGPGSSRVGVYLDHRAGLLSFYRVSDTMTCLLRVRATFTQPLYAGFCLHSVSSAEFCKLK